MTVTPPFFFSLVTVSFCAAQPVNKKTALEKYQAVLGPERPLAGMTTAKRAEAWVRICEEIQKAVSEAKTAKAISERERALGLFLDYFEEYLKCISEAKEIVVKIDNGTLPGDFVINAPWLGIEPNRLKWEDSKFLPLELGLRVKNALYNAEGSNGLLLDIKSGAWEISKGRDGNGFVYYRLKAAEEEGRQILALLREFAVQPKWIDTLPRPC
jgi:hypothetical protein